VELQRLVTDEQVVRAFMQHRRLTRAELAAEIGISKPTAGESVRRLAERGLLVDTGDRTPGGRGRGRVGSYYALSPEAGTALAVSIAPEGVAGERVDAYGDTVARAERKLSRPASPASVGAALRDVAAEVGDGVRLAVVSAADPVERRTGRLVHLPDAPFLVGDLDPVAILAPCVARGGSTTVDNDVNWAARAELEHDRSLTDFAYLFLGEGLGCAIVSDGEVLRGAAGLAGEIAEVLTTGPDDRAVRFIDVFGELGLRRPGSTAIDVDRLLAASSTQLVGRAVAGVVAAVVALTDPERIVVGGAWGPALLGPIREALDWLARPVPIKAAEIGGDAAFAGVRADALSRLRSAVVSAVP